MKKIIFILLCIPLATIAQEDLMPVEIELTYVQRYDSLVLTATTRDEDGEPIQGLDILFSVHIAKNSATLGSSKTNAKGVARISKKLDDLRKSGHLFHFEAVFKGDDTYDASSIDLEIRDAKLGMVTEVIDSVNTVSLHLTSWDDNNEEMNVSDVEILFYVPRLFSLLPIGDAYTNRHGQDEFEFPTDLPGGPKGELTIVSRIEEHEDFGTIEIREAVTWGIPVALNTSKQPRALFSRDAPIWMLITFIILMLGVWCHYFLIIFKLFQIRNKGNTSEALIYTE